jgi:hypothetical protein
MRKYYGALQNLRFLDKQTLIWRIFLRQFCGKISTSHSGAIGWYKFLSKLIRMTSRHMHIVLCTTYSKTVRVNVRQRNSFYINLVANNGVSKV